MFALGVDDKDVNTVKRAFRFEAWGGDLVIQRELETEADLAVVQEISPGPGRAHLQAYLDQEAGRILVCSQSGKQLASLKVGGSKSRRHPGSTWRTCAATCGWNGCGSASGAASCRARSRSTSRASIAPTARSSTDRWLGSTRSAGTFVVNGDSGETRIAPTRSPAFSCRCPATTSPRAIRAVYQDGTRMSGELEKVEKGALVMTVPGISEPPRLPIDGLAVAGRDDGHRDAPPLAKSERPAGSSSTASSAGQTGRWPRASPGRAAWSGSRWAATRPVPSSRRLRSHHLQGASSAGRATQCRRSRSQGMVFIGARQPRSASGVGGMVGRFMTRWPSPPEATVDPRKSAGRSICATATSSPRSSPRSTPTASGSRPASRRARSWPTPRSRPSSWRAEPPSSADSVRLTQVKEGAAAHVAADAKGRPAHALDPLQERRLPPRAGDEDGRQDARGRGPSRKQGSAARSDFADHLAARRRARRDQEAGRSRRRTAVPRACRRCAMTASGSRFRRTGSPARRSPARATCWGRARWP